MTKWDYRIKDLELALKKVCDQDKIDDAKKIALEALATTEKSSALGATDKDPLTVGELTSQLEKYRTALKKIAESWVLNSARLIAIAVEALE
jgi:hypothetical protein